MRLLTNTAVEERVLRRVRRKAFTFGQDIEADESVLGLSEARPPRLPEITRDHPRPPEITRDSTRLLLAIEAALAVGQTDHACTHGHATFTATRMMPAAAAQPARPLGRRRRQARRHPRESSSARLRCGPPLTEGVCACAGGVTVRCGGGARLCTTQAGARA